MGLFGGGNSSSTTNKSETLQQDQRIVAGNGSTTLASGATYTGTDPGAVQFAALAAELSGAVAESQSDAVKFMSLQGSEQLRQMGAAATQIYGQAGKNTAESWGATTKAQQAMFEKTAGTLDATWRDTMDASAALLGDLSKQSAVTVTAASQLANTAISSFQPTDNKNADTIQKIGLYAAAAVAALLFFSRMKKA